MFELLNELHIYINDIVIYATSLPPLKKTIWTITYFCKTSVIDIFNTLISQLILMQLSNSMQLF